MIIWIMGSMASGKTTLNKALMYTLSQHIEVFDYDIVKGTEDGVNYMYTKYGKVASIGQMKKGVATCGIDPVMGWLKTEGVELSIRKANEECEFVIVEGAQAAYTWFDFMEKIDPEFLLVHLNISYDENIKRLKLRQFKKKYNKEPKFNAHLSLSISDKNYDSVLGKNKQYMNIWNKVQDRVNNKLQVDALNSPEQIEMEVLNKILSLS